jgi:hypothetical protein
MAAHAAGGRVSACYLGVTFYREVGVQQLFTSVALMFDEPSRGGILKGRRAHTESGINGGVILPRYRSEHHRRAPLKSRSPRLKGSPRSQFIAQDKGQIESVYGKGDTASILGSCVTTRIFGLGRAESETANWAANALGDQTVLARTKQSAAKFWGEPQDVDRRAAPEADDGRSDIGDEGGRDATADRVKTARACRGDRFVSASCISGEAGSESDGVIAWRHAQGLYREC